MKTEIVDCAQVIREADGEVLRTFTSLAGAERWIDEEGDPMAVANGEYGIDFPVPIRISSTA